MTERIAIQQLEPSIAQRDVPPHIQTWIRPAIESDGDARLAWKLRYAPDTITRADQVTIAIIIDAYGWLLLDSTADQRNHISSEIRNHMAREATEQDQAVGSRP